MRKIKQKAICQELTNFDEVIAKDYETAEVCSPKIGNNSTTVIEKDKLDIDEATVVKTMSNMSSYVWSINNRTLKGKPYVFDGESLVQKRPFLIQPLEDNSPYKGFRKCRQVGVSEICVTEALWFLDTNNHSKVCYTLPSGRQVQDFSNTRVAPAIDESKYLLSLKGQIQNVNLKQIRDSFMFLRSGQLERLGEGIDTDCTFFDELDRMNPRIKIAFEESLQSSKWGWIRDISTPTVPNFGVDVGWNKSKQYHWFIKCSHCGKSQTMSFLPDEDVAGKTSISVNKLGIHIYVCKYCDKELRVEDRWQGEWVAKFPTEGNSFYQISQLDAPWISAQILWQKQEDYPFKQLFFNYCLGIPYLGDNILVTEGQIISCITDNGHLFMPVSESFYGRVAVGVDWGDTSWVTIVTSYKGKILIVGLEKITANDPDEHVESVKRIIENYDADIVVCDAGYGRDRNSKLLKMFPEKVYSCWYPSVERGSKIFEPSFQDEQGKVSIDRTNSLKLTLSYFRSHEIILPRGIDIVLLQTFIKHLCNCVSVKDIDEKTGEVGEFIASMGQDHFAHSLNYAVTGFGKISTMPKSEFWDGGREIEDAIKQKRKVSITLPDVPGYGDLTGILARSTVKGTILTNGECYGEKYQENEKCFNCQKKHSCKSLMIDSGVLV
jgi:hypothetical protein